MSEANFYFGRLNFKHQIHSLDRFSDDGDLPDRETIIRSLLLDYARSDGPVYRQTDSQEWYFGRVQEHDEFLCGKFGKVFPEQPTTYDEDKGDFVDESKQDRQADYSMFIIYPKKNIIIYNQRKRVGYQQFRSAFAEGYSNHVGIEDAMTVNLLQNETDVRQIIENAKVSEAEFDLVPTNPTTDPDMKKIDSHIQEMGAQDFTLHVESSSSTLNMESELLEGGIAMTNNGYGDYRLQYEMDGQSQILTSEDKPAVKRLEQPDTLGGFEEQYAEELISYAKTLTTYSE